MKGMRICAILIILWLFSFQIRVLEKKYEGTHVASSLSIWVAWYGADKSDPSQQKRAAEGIRNLRTNALPYLLTWIQCDGDPTNQATENAAADKRSQDAAIAFDALESADSLPAVPSLTAMMNDTNHLMTATNAITALYVIARNGGEKATEALQTYLADTNSLNRMFVAIYFGMSANFGAKSSIVTQLIRCTDDHDRLVRGCAANSLAKIAQRSNHPPAKLLVPVLVDCLQQGYFAKAQKNIIQGLAAYGSEATNAVPALIAVTILQDEDMRAAATNAILKIQPEALTGAMAN
jgi:hypothetical protein